MSARLADLTLLILLAGLAAMLAAAGLMQIGFGELPCMLCLLERIAMFGAAFGIIAHFRKGYDPRNVGLSLLWAVFLLVVSVRQVLINITPRPGHAYPGSAVLGLHLPVWSALAATALLTVFAAQLALLDPARQRAVRQGGRLTRTATLLGWSMVALCAANLASAVVQCGLGACHTSGYRLLGGA